MSVLLSTGEACASNTKTLESSKEHDISNDVIALHTACSYGDKNSLKKLIDSVSVRSLESKDSLGRTPLILSVIHGHLDCTTILLKAGARVDNSDNTGQTALHTAVNKGFHRCVKLLLSHSAAWDQKDFAGVTSLHLSAIHPSPKCVILILKKLKPGEIDIQDSSNKTALHWSTAYSNIEHVKILLNQDANICIPDEEGKTPLHWAVTSSASAALECAKVLLEKEPRVIDWQDYEGRSALHLAVATGGVDIVSYLASRENCNIDILDNMFCTPLHWAAKRGLSDETDILLTKRACHTSADGNGATPLHYAAHHNHADTVRVFLSRNYINDEADSDGRNAFMWAAARNADDVIQVMHECGADILFQDKGGATALHAAAIQGHASTIELLTELGAEIDAIDNMGMTPLLRACELGRTKAVQMLIDKGASLIHKDVNKRACLHWSALGGHAYLCQILLHQGCKLNTQDAFGLTPLHYASLNGYINCVSVLLESKADTDVSDNEAKTPLHWAVLNDKLGAVKLLCEYDANVNSMALLNGWVTPLDCALLRDFSDIIAVLRKYDALTSLEIENFAACKIQSWFRCLRSNRKNDACEQNKLKYNTVNNSKFCSPSSSANSETLKNFSNNSKLAKYALTKSKIPVAKWRPSIGYGNFHDKLNSKVILCYQCSILSKNSDVQESFRMVEKSAVVIQNAWKRYILKKRFQRIRDTVKTSFPSNKKRHAAEKDWKMTLSEFLDEL